MQSNMDYSPYQAAVMVGQKAVLLPFLSEPLIVDGSRTDIEEFTSQLESGAEEFGHF